MENLELVKNIEGTLVVSSRQVAKDFGKDHAKILRSIEGYISENPILASQSYFIESNYKTNGNNRTYKEYLLTRDGFSLLVMGFTGVKALEWKLKYIEAFNNMKQQLNKISDRDRLLLGLFSDDKAVVAESHKALVKMEVEKATMPLLHKIEEDEPKVVFAETALKSSDNILVRELAKIATNEGIKLGQNQLYEKLREWKYIMKGKTEPYQSAVDKGYFVVEEKNVKTPYGVKLTQTTKVTPLGQIKIIEKLRKEI